MNHGLHQAAAITTPVMAAVWSFFALRIEMSSNFLDGGQMTTLDWKQVVNVSTPFVTATLTMQDAAGNGFHQEFLSTDNGNFWAAGGVSQVIGRSGFSFFGSTLPPFVPSQAILFPKPYF